MIFKNNLNLEEFAVELLCIITTCILLVISIPEANFLNVIISVGLLVAVIVWIKAQLSSEVTVESGTITYVYYKFPTGFVKDSIIISKQLIARLGYPGRWSAYMYTLNLKDFTKNSVSILLRQSAMNHLVQHLKLNYPEINWTSI